MDELFQKLENESLLLLYLAGELPELDRLELEALLASDAGLRNQLEALRSAWELSSNSLAELDARDRIGSTDRAVRQVGAAMRQWQVDRLTALVETPVAPRRLRYLAYSGTIAASILLLFCTWWGLRPDGPVASTQPIEQATDGTLAKDDSKPEATPAPQYSAGEITTGVTPLVTLDANSTQLADLERSVSDDLH